LIYRASKLEAFDTWDMGVCRNFSKGGQRRHFANPFSGCERCNATVPSQNALPFLHHKENSP